MVQRARLGCHRRSSRIEPRRRLPRSFASPKNGSNGRFTRLAASHSVWGFSTFVSRWTRRRGKYWMSSRREDRLGSSVIALATCSFSRVRPSSACSRCSHGHTLRWGSQWHARCSWDLLNIPMMDEPQRLCSRWRCGAESHSMWRREPGHGIGDCSKRRSCSMPRQQGEAGRLENSGRPGADLGAANSSGRSLELELFAPRISPDVRQQS